MAAKNVGTLIKEARTAAGLTQEQLAKKVDGVTASDISKAERSELALSQAALKQIAKATGVTQASLPNAPKGSAAKKPSSSSSQTGSSSSSSSSSAKKKTTGTSVKVTATEKKLLEYYRAADSDTKKAAMQLLKGEEDDSGDTLSAILNNALSLLKGKK